MVITIDVDEDLVDPNHPTGLSFRGFAYIGDALRSFGTNIHVNNEPIFGCDHPDTEVDGEYLRCSRCKIIVGRA